MLDNLKDHAGKLTGTWILGTVTWISETTNIIGMLGAFVGLLAGVMLVAIRWKDFTESAFYKYLARRFGG